MALKKYHHTIHLPISPGKRTDFIRMFLQLDEVNNIIYILNTPINVGNKDPFFTSFEKECRLIFMERPILLHFSYYFDNDNFTFQFNTNYSNQDFLKSLFAKQITRALEKLEE